jgi:hypothetical protein
MPFSTGQPDFIGHFAVRPSVRWPNASATRTAACADVRVFESRGSAGPAANAVAHPIDLATEVM